MQVVRGVLDDLCVTTTLEVHGTITGQLTVASGGRLVFRGVCERDVLVERGGDAELWGLIQGDVCNQGGTVKLFGMVEGQVRTPDGETKISHDSRVGGRRVV
jgi:hypothetical protein